MGFVDMFEFLTMHEETVKFVLIVITSLALIILGVLAFKYEKRNGDSENKVKKLTAISMLSALSVILYYFVKFPLGVILPFIPSFLDIHFSNVPIYIGGYLLGPMSGSIIAVIRAIVKLPGSTTLGIGELADLIIGLATVLVSSMIYHKNKTKKSAIIGNVMIIVIWLIVGVLANWLVILPFYIHAFGFDGVFALLNVIPGLNEANYMWNYILYAVIPFNLILATIVSLITFILYKRLSIIYQKL